MAKIHNHFSQKDIDELIKLMRKHLNQFFILVVVL